LPCCEYIKYANKLLGEEIHRFEECLSMSNKVEEEDEEAKKDEAKDPK